MRASSRTLVRILSLVLALGIIAILARALLAPRTVKFPDEWYGSIDKKHLSVVEGEITQTSPLPNPATNSYPDCYFTARFRVKRALSGAPTPQEFVLVLPGFIKRHVCNESSLKKGDRVRAEVLLFENLPEDKRQIQQADAIDSLDLEYFFSARVTKISKWSPKPKKPAVAAKKPPKPAESAPILPVDAKAEAQRSESMAKDLVRINALLAQHGGSFEKWNEETVGLRKAYEKASRKRASKWVGDSFFSAGPAEFTTQPVSVQPFVDSMVELNQYLKKRNIDLILARVPNKGDICVDEFAAPYPKDGVFNPYFLALDKKLLEAGIEVIDVLPAAHAERLKFPLMYYYENFDEGHPAEGMSWVVAEELAKRLDRYSVIQGRRRHFSYRMDNQPMEDFRWPAGNPRFDPRKPIEFRVITNGDGTTLSLTEGVTSPIFVMGNSFITHPQMSRGGSIPHYLAYHCGVAPDIFYRAGAHDFARFLARKGPAFLARRRVCVYPVHPATPTTPPEGLIGLRDLYDRASMKPLAARSGSDLATLDFSPKLGSHAFRLTDSGEIEIRPREGKAGAGGTLRIPLSGAIPRQGKIVLEMVFATNDYELFNAEYAGTTRIIGRSKSDPDTAERIIFPAVDSKDQKPEIVVHFEKYLSKDRPTLLKRVSVYSAN